MLISKSKWPITFSLFNGLKGIELNKLIKAKIVNLKITTHDDLGISQGSVLSPFLFICMQV